MMKVLITGSNGFIGRHVCRYLKKAGFYVIGLGRRTSSLTEADEYICCDLSTEHTGRILQKTKTSTVDAVIHLAADMRKEPYAAEVVSANCTGTQRLLELCEEHNIPAFIQLSSLPVIGKPMQHPITEEHPLAPPTVYHVTKRTQELLANYAWYTFGLRTVSFRISSPVGIGMNPKTILPVFLNQAISGKDIMIYGQGTRKQTYIHVADIAHAIHKAILSNVQGVYNLSSENIFSNYELAAECIKLTNSSSRMIYSKTADPMDDYIWDVSLDKITADLGYKPEISMDFAIKELCKHIKEE